MLGNAVRQILEDYPKIFHACHTRHVRDPASRALVSARQASILDHLDGVEPTTLTALARHSGVTASTMSLAIDRLVRMGYVRRVRDRADARRVHLTLTAAGARLRDAQQVLEPERVRAMLERLPPDDLETALRGLRLLARAAIRELPNTRVYGLERPSDPEGRPQ